LYSPVASFEINLTGGGKTKSGSKSKGLMGLGFAPETKNRHVKGVQTFSNLYIMRRRESECI